MTQVQGRKQKTDRVKILRRLAAPRGISESTTACFVHTDGTAPRAHRLYCTSCTQTVLHHQMHEVRPIDKPTVAHRVQKFYVFNGALFKRSCLWTVHLIRRSTRRPLKDPRCTEAPPISCHIACLLYVLQFAFWSEAFFKHRMRG